MGFNEETLEQAVIELFRENGIPNFHGEAVHKELSEVLLRDDLREFLLNRYSADEISPNEIKNVIRELEKHPAAALYSSNKAIMKLVADGFALKREDRSKKDLYIHFID